MIPALENVTMAHELAAARRMGTSFSCGQLSLFSASGNLQSMDFRSMVVPPSGKSRC